MVRSHKASTPPVGAFDVPAWDTCHIACHPPVTYGAYGEPMTRESGFLRRRAAHLVGTGGPP
jgi:hypothetical protein